MEDHAGEVIPLTRVARNASARFSSHQFAKYISTWRTTVRYFLRSVGLGVLSASHSRRHTSRRPEEKKVVIETSFWIALARCCVHIIPVTGSIILLWFNFYGYYIGSQLSGPGWISDDVKFHLLQFAAKGHELSIIASIATIVFSILRYQLLFGSGIPLGLIGSGKSFSELGYFWYVRFSISKSTWLSLAQVSRVLGCNALSSISVAEMSTIWFLVPRWHYRSFRWSF